MLEFQPVLWQQLVDFRVGVIVDASEHVGEVSLGIDLGQPAVLDQREHQCSPRSCIGVSDEQPVFRAEFEWAKSVFGEIVVDARRGVLEARTQRLLVPEHVADRLGHRGLQQQLIACVCFGHFVEFVQDRLTMALSYTHQALGGHLGFAGGSLEVEESVDAIEIGVSLALCSFGRTYKVTAQMGPTSQMDNPVFIGQPPEVGGRVGLQDTFEVFKCLGRSFARLGPAELEEAGIPIEDIGLEDSGPIASENTSGSGSYYEVYFTSPESVPDGVTTGGQDTNLIALINGAQSTIDLAVFEFNLQQVADALIAAHNRGVQVRVVYDDEHTEDDPQMEQLIDAGIPAVPD